MESRVNVAAMLQRFDYPDGTSLCATVAKDFLGNSRVLGPRGDRLGVWNPPRACTRYPLPVVSATLVVGAPRGILNGESIKYPLCEENDIASVTGVCSVSWYAGVICICLYRAFCFFCLYDSNNKWKNIKKEFNYITIFL